MRPRTIDLVGPLARRTVVAATVASILVTLSAPLALYSRTRRTTEELARDSAQRMALLARDVVYQLPDLWSYAAPKFARHLHLRNEHPLVARIAIVSAEGLRLDVSGEAAGDPYLVWASAPVHRGGSEVARVWVGVDGTRMMTQLIVVALVSLILGSVLSTLLYLLPLRVVAEAEGRIVSLVGKLDQAMEELAALNRDLERRVDLRSRELAETAEALRTSETKLRRMAAHAAEATEEERVRVARELHDGAGQVLTGIRLSLQVVGTVVGENEDARRRLDETERLVDDAIDEVRRIAMALRPAALDRLGLIESLEELTQSMGSRAHLTIDFEAPSIEERLPAAVESTAFRVVQESLTNIVRYAQAERAAVVVERTDEALRIAVTDDGKGFDDSKPRTGLGLAGMEERVALLGGSLTVESAEGSGTRIGAMLPTQKPARSDEPGEELER